MNLREFRERAKKADFAVDQHVFRGPQFIFMLDCGAFALPAGFEPLEQLLGFAKSGDFDFFGVIEWHHASERDLTTGYSPLVWQPRGRATTAPQGRIFLKEWAGRLLRDRDRLRGHG